MIAKTKLLFLLTLFTAIIACKKNDIQDSFQEVDKAKSIRFFELKSDTKSHIVRLNRELFELNQRNQFIKEFIKLAGYPRWDKGFSLTKRSSNKRVQLRSSANDSTIIIPVVSESDKAVTGAIIVRISDTTSYHLVLLNNYQSYNANKSTFIKAMMILDAKVYGYNKFKIMDTSAINNTNEIYFSPKRHSSNSNRTESVNYDDPCEIIEIWYDPDGDADPCDCSGNEYYTGEWFYADEENCFSGTPQPVLSFLLGTGGAGGGYQLPNGYFTLPDLGGGGTGTNNPPYIPVPTTDEQKTDYLVQQLNLNQLQQFYLVNTPDAISTIFNYIYSNNTAERRNLAIWVLNFIPQNSDIPFSTLDNWFFKEPEYMGGEAVIDPDLITYDQSLQQTALPSLSNFMTYFPKQGSNGSYTQMESLDVYQLVGSTLYSNHLSGNPNYQNACSIRGSRALLYSGIHIPILNYNGSQRTEKGSDNKNYILDAVSFNKFMIDKFGDTPYKLTGADANDPQKIVDLLRGKNGIYVIINNDPRSRALGGAGYSGHVDLILNGRCIGGSYTTPTGGVKSIRIWVLN
jgi:hypothetical protein